MDIYTLGEQVLRNKAEPVLKFDSKLVETLESMVVTMHRARGIGLAAPQVGISQRFFVVQLENEKPLYFINPEIISTSSEKILYEEGCLSIPGVYAEIERSSALVVQALNEKGKRFTLEASGLLARVIFHENDHLDGVLFIDKLIPSVRKKLIEQYEKRMRA
ncbi:MAG TPA: peptide deformylase [Spirochaetia bacterium]|nr:peptide deformylase [Spirochaetales bacterium]HPD80199.1 peptide deformylase [Spirochaetales bacterium]HQK33362.1 peptide deformylase [Spirochaetales bacterium]HRS66963.1 peptide deformylase [Spirochaetia bacterium]HRV28692.1 peptide deformylase [Spirochaetia bacterium]